MDAQKRIKQLMEERGWTDYRLAKESGLSHSTVTNMFNRNNAPTLPTLEAVCRAFGITLSQFFSDGNGPAEFTVEQRTLFSKWSALNDKQKKVSVKSAGSKENRSAEGNQRRGSKEMCSSAGRRRINWEQRHSPTLHGTIQLWIGCDGISK